MHNRSDNMKDTAFYRNNRFVIVTDEILLYRYLQKQQVARIKKLRMYNQNELKLDLSLQLTS